MTRLHNNHCDPRVDRATRAARKLFGDPINQRNPIIQQRRLRQQQRVHKLEQVTREWLRGQWRVGHSPCPCRRNHYVIEVRTRLGPELHCPAVFWGWLTILTDLELPIDKFVKPITDWREETMSTANEVRALALFDELRELSIGDLDDEAVIKLGRQIIRVLPTQSIRNPVNAVAYALHCQSVGGNILRQEPYGFETKDGKLQIVDPYKIRVRWAKRIADYCEEFERLDPEAHGQHKGDIVARCTILLNEKVSLLRDLVAAGASYDEAKRIVSSSAVGVVKLEEMFFTREKKDGRWVPAPRERWKPIDPPKGWTWEQRAETRALKNALQRSHGTPSTKELAQESWVVGDTQTIPSDWATVRPGAPPYEAEATALVEAEAREVRAQVKKLPPQEVLERARRVLRGDDEDPLAPEALMDNDVVNVEPEPAESKFELLDRASILLADLGDEADIADGTHRFLIQQVFTVLKLGNPKWPMTVAEVVKRIKSAAPQDEAEADKPGSDVAEEDDDESGNEGEEK